MRIGERSTACGDLWRKRRHVPPPPRCRTGAALPTQGSHPTRHTRNVVRKAHTRVCTHLRAHTRTDQRAQRSQPPFPRVECIHTDHKTASIGLRTRHTTSSASHYHAHARATLHHVSASATAVARLFYSLRCMQQIQQPGVQRMQSPRREAGGGTTRATAATATRTTLPLPWKNMHAQRAAVVQEVGRCRVRVCGDGTRAGRGYNPCGGTAQERGGTFGKRFVLKERTRVNPRLCAARGEVNSYSGAPFRAASALLCGRRAVTTRCQARPACVPSCAVWT